MGGGVGGRGGGSSGGRGGGMGIVSCYILATLEEIAIVSERCSES